VLDMPEESIFVTRSITMYRVRKTIFRDVFHAIDQISRPVE